MKKLVFFDIDGTLYDNEHDQIPLSTIEALKLLKQNDDVEIAIATGRANFILDRVQPIIEYFDAFVFLNGLQIVYKGKEIYCHIPEKGSVQSLLQSFKARNLIHGCFNRTDEYISHLNDKIIDDFSSVNLEVPEIIDIEEVDDIMQVYFFGDDEDFKHIQDLHPEFRVVPWHTNGADILPHDISKEVGIKMLSEKLGYSMEDVFAFGDASNDLEMIKAAGVGVAMGNATDELKAVADYVTDPVSENGIYNALKHFNLI